LFSREAHSKFCGGVRQKFPYATWMSRLSFLPGKMIYPHK
jgi:hypothetical protein